MCGIVAVVGRPGDHAVPAASELLRGLDAAATALHGQASPAVVLRAAVDELAAVDRSLQGVAGVLALAGHPELDAAIVARLDGLDAGVTALEAYVETGDDDEPVDGMEALNAALVAARDVLWALRHDRLRTARAVADLAGRDASTSALAGFTAVQVALSSLDRLEVRGRDSAGLHLLVWDHGLDLASDPVTRLLAGRDADTLFTSGSVRVADGSLAFVYKAAAEIGELGDNTAALRAAMRDDGLLHLALSAPTARVTVLGHTRWASVGIISEPNAHPVNSDEDGGDPGPYVTAVLNGDVDNHADLKARWGLRIPTAITTDAKVIPALVARQAAGTGDVTEAFRRTVASFEGSVAIGAVVASQPNRVWLAQRGSGQGLYVGLAEGAFVVASEPYGLVEETSRYLRIDGETPLRADQPNSRGQVFVLDGARAGELAGITALAYDGTELDLGEADVKVAEITTRDIDRGTAPHFLLKEITESPASFRKTLRGRIRLRDGLLHAELGERTIPSEVAARLRAGAIQRVVVIGQGTAAVAGQSFAAILAGLASGSALRVETTTATEFSGYGLPPDLGDTLVVAVSQSGTTTDTNRTVDLARERGAAVIGIVNRRNSDLTDKAHGVLYTSDGRDVEMSVASTKAFYAQVAAGALLACAISELHGSGDGRHRHELLASLRELPDAMTEVIARRPDIAEAAHLFAPSRRYWAVVGSGVNKVAAEEVRIKLSELCYKSIACDVTEDKKHIDLSSEPLILVCGAGLVGSTADDIAKEVAIYRAHKAAPIVIASDGEERFHAALRVISVPAVAPELAFVLSAMVGHLFGYEAALAIDALARPLREAREVLELAVVDGFYGDRLYDRLRARVEPLFERFVDILRTGAYDGHLEASTAVRLVSLLRYAAGYVPLDVYQAEHGVVGTPEVLVDDLTAALTRAIDELTRPIDAIKHQAKTVTVGISRSDESLLGSRLVQAVLSAGAGRDRISYRTLKALSDLDPAVEDVTGFIRYAIEGDPESGEAHISIVDRGGLAREVPSRVERNPVLLGTKRRVASDKEVLVARGRADGRTVLIVPEVKGAHATGITLLHVRFADRLSAATAKSVLQGYRGRYELLTDWVTETEASFRDDLLGDVPVIDLLTLPVTELAERWRA
jgi:glucosamine--fructose-6-phosphate aminotransferase (isomerizing)